MKDRLIELLKKSPTLDVIFGDEWEKSADYLLANGVIVPPCKVGDTVYMVRPCKNEIVSLTVIQIEKDSDNLWIRADDGIMHCVRPYTDYCYTKEEAEQALEKLKGGANNDEK